MSEDKNMECPHCGSKLDRCYLPGSGWEGDQYICFNDECGYFIRGWKHMEENYQQKASYRHRFNPEAGTSGPIAVHSINELKDAILKD